VSTVTTSTFALPTSPVPRPDRARRTVRLLVAALLFSGVAACESRTDPPLALQLVQPGDSTAGLSLLPASVDMRVGGNAQLSLSAPSTLLPASFSTSAPAVATVSGTGLVTAVTVGTALITASSTRDPTRQASATVRVLGP
jgi:hypothetical protein